MPIPAVERLVNLTIALLETRRPLTFEEVRRRTRFYDQSDPASARRMFERDKEQLRGLGVPIETRQVAGMEDPGYLIDRRAYELRDIALLPEEVAALMLAVDMVGAAEGALPLAKVAARAPDPAPITAPPTRVGLEVTAVDPLAVAVVERRTVRFGYRTASGSEGERILDPYGIVRRRRAWYLVGRDHARGEPRGFRLDRMTTPVEVVGGPDAFEVPPGLDLGAIVSGPEVPPVPVTLDVLPEGRWEVEARGGRDIGAGTDTSRRMAIDGIDRVRDQAWLLAVSPEVAVIEPDDIRAGLTVALGRIAALHTDVASGGAA